MNQILINQTNENLENGEAETLWNEQLQIWRRDCEVI